MSNLHYFTNKENLSLLWEVLLDELKINTSNLNITNNIKTVFESNIIPFKSNTNPNLNIMDLNKQFLSQVLLAVNRLFPNIKNEQNIKRIKIFEEDFIEPYKIEDIHSLRQNNFEKEVEKKKLELEKFMTPPTPKELDFSDNNTDGRIKYMDSLISEKMNQRNLDIEQIQNLNFNSFDIEPDQWLKPKETSIKNEKFNFEQKSTDEKKSIFKNNNENSRLKHISFDKNNNITLNISENENLVKKVTWGDDQQDQNINIFTKLKKRNIDNNDNNIQENQYNQELVKPQYIEQKSIQLSEVKKEEILLNINNTNNPQIQNDPILPKIEIVKQLNDMNSKIENIVEFVTISNEKKLSEIGEKVSNLNDEFNGINLKIDKINITIEKLTQIIENLNKINNS